MAEPGLAQGALPGSALLIPSSTGSRAPAVRLLILCLRAQPPAVYPATTTSRFSSPVQNIQTEMVSDTGNLLPLLSGRDRFRPRSNN